MIDKKWEELLFFLCQVAGWIALLGFGIVTVAIVLFLVPCFWDGLFVDKSKDCRDRVDLTKR